MDRFVSDRATRIAALCAILFAASLGGCNLISEFAYIIHDDNIPAEYPDLPARRSRSFAGRPFSCNTPIPAPHLIWPN